jgi:hypothetical protein
MVRDRNFKAGILLREPFEELSERLLILKWASLSSANSTAAVLGQTIQLCAKNFCNVNLGDLTALQDLLSRPSDDLRAVLYNPIVYQLAAPNAFDPPRTPQTAAALDSLAEMDAVGLRDDAGAFLRLIGAVLQPFAFERFVRNRMNHSIGMRIDGKIRADGRRRLRAANGPPGRRFRRGRERQRVSCREPAAVAVAGTHFDFCARPVVSDALPARALRPPGAAVGKLPARLGRDRLASAARTRSWARGLVFRRAGGGHRGVDIAGFRTWPFLL